MLAVDGTNLLRYGSNAPRMHELVWLDPANIKQCNTAFMSGQSGRVRDGEWDRELTKPLMASVKIRACILHWRDGIPWEETGVYDHVMQMICTSGGRFDNCVSMDDVIARYQGMDRLFEEVKREGRLRTRREVSEGTFREKQGIVVHFDRRGAALFAHRGSHRLAIAIVLGFETIPAQVGVVHLAAIHAWRRSLQPAKPGSRP